MMLARILANRRWHRAARLLLLAVVMPVVVARYVGCGSKFISTIPATQPDNPLIGSWAGSTQIIVNWTQARSLPVRLCISADGSVSGSVGDAQLKEGVIGPTHFLGLVFGVPESSHGTPPALLRTGDSVQITALLNGPLIAAEQINRDGVIIVFKRSGPDTLRGGLTSTGTDFGGKASMKLASRNMVLFRLTR